MDAENTLRDRDELRSKKVKQIGRIPRSLVRCGIIIIAVITAVLITAICILPYPYSNGETILHHLVRII